MHSTFSLVVVAMMALGVVIAANEPTPQEDLDILEITAPVEAQAEEGITYDDMDKMTRIKTDWRVAYRTVEKREAETDTSSVTCDWGAAGGISNLADRIALLHGGRGPPRYDLDAGTCARIVCGYKATIWWCNDSPEHLTVDKWQIADSARHTINVCQGNDRYVSGRNIEAGGWSTYVGIFSHVLGLSPTAKKWDLRTALTIAFIRTLLNDGPPTTISAQQAMFLNDPGVKGKMWVSKVTMPAPPEDDLRRQLRRAITALGQGGEQYTTPALEAVGAEWVGYRDGVSDKTPEPSSMSEEEKYENLTREAKEPTMILYFHGGSNYLMDPVSTRPVAAKYAALTRGRVFSVRYRLAPQGPFPAALLDALIAYLSLLYPPPGTYHEPVPAASIVVCGDSAGGNLATAFLQTLLQFHRTVPTGQRGPTVLFHGTEVAVPMPAGVALNSPSMDLTRCLHWDPDEASQTYDYLPPPTFSPAQSPPCEVWPTDPPRVDLFCEGSALAHPLVSPLAAASWAGSPPLFVVCGEEVLARECKLFAQKAARQGVPVVWEQYEAMPHCFALFLDWTPGTAMSFAGWTKFVQDAVRKPSQITTTGHFVTAEKLDRRSVDVCGLTHRSEEDVLRLMMSARDRIEKRFSYLLE
ncbi:lipase/esterase [Purpureocillium lavendulum]|uniref:Lipase/esterase n=1 Tax=Purpureocillium lavendulum TaxID=1247861 RepID=A0AB34FKU9_9HYPO|nr:lipase/esterase [Purpureocillium lavendulum]